MPEFTTPSQRLPGSLNRTENVFDRSARTMAELERVIAENPDDWQAQMQLTMAQAEDRMMDELMHNPPFPGGGVVAKGAKLAPQGIQRLFGNLNRGPALRASNKAAQTGNVGQAQRAQGRLNSAQGAKNVKQAERAQQARQAERAQQAQQAQQTQQAQKAPQASKAAASADDVAAAGSRNMLQRAGDFARRRPILTTTAGGGIAGLLGMLASSIGGDGSSASANIEDPTDPEIPAPDGNATTDPNENAVAASMTDEELLRARVMDIVKSQLGVNDNEDIAQFIANQMQERAGERELRNNPTGIQGLVKGIGDKLLDVNYVTRGDPQGRLRDQAQQEMMQQAIEQGDLELVMQALGAPERQSMLEDVAEQQNIQTGEMKELADNPLGNLDPVTQQLLMQLFAPPAEPSPFDKFMAMRELDFGALDQQQ